MYTAVEISRVVTFLAHSFDSRLAGGDDSIMIANNFEKTVVVFLDKLYFLVLRSDRESFQYY